MIVLPIRLSDKREDGRSMRDVGRDCGSRSRDGDSFLDRKLNRLLGLLRELRVDMRVEGLSNAISGGAAATGGSGIGSWCPLAFSTFGLLKRLKSEEDLDFFCRSGFWDAEIEGVSGPVCGADVEEDFAAREEGRL